MSTKKQSPQSAGSVPLAHHAYLGHGSTKQSATLIAFLEQHFSIPLSHTQNAHIFILPTCGVDDSREVIERAYLRPVGGDGYIVLIADAITPEAQNALLKILEEPPAHVYLFLLFPKHQRILTTITSRVVPLHTPVVSDTDDVRKYAEELLGAPLSRRIAMIGEMVEEKDKQKAFALLDALEQILGDSLATGTTTQQTSVAKKLALIHDTRSDLLMSGAMLKLLLESLVLLI